MSDGEGIRPISMVDNHGADPRWAKVLTVIFCLYFVAKLFYFAFNIAPGIPPDEMTHVGIAGVYSNEGFRVHNSADSYHLGLITRTPNLYYVTLGALSHLNVFSMDPTKFLRLINIFFSIGTLWVTLLLVRRFTKNVLTTVLFVVMFTNTLMFTFLSAAVNYDNLVNLLAVLSLYAMVEFFEKQTPRALLTFFLWPLLGALVKVSFLPLGLLLLSVFLVERNRSLVSDLSGLGQAIARRRVSTLFLLIVVSAALVANVMLYGVNFVRYKRLVPACDQVLDLEVCMENRIFARGWIVQQYRDGHIQLQDAIQKTWIIDNPGDRDHALRLLQNERAYQQASRPAPIPAWDYMHVVWVQAMKPAIYGIQAHISMLKDPRQLLPYNLILFAAFILWIRQLSLDRDRRLTLYFSAIAIGYFVILVGWYNYEIYERSHALFLGVQGRYVFPVLVPAYLVVAQALTRSRSKYLNVGLALIVAVAFIYGDLPFFIRHAVPLWFGFPS